MIDAPSFVLSGRDGTLVAQGVHAAYPDIGQARAALRSGRTPILVGALPFDVGNPAALMAPRTHQFTDTLPSWPAQPASNVRIAATVPTAEQHGERIRRALAALRDPDNALRKVVLARALQVSAERPWDVRTVLRQLAAADPQAYSYLADLTPAGPDHAGRTLIGASPELLVARHGDKVTCRPFAGSAPRSPDAETDRANGAALAESAKNRVEHSLVVDEMRKALDPLCVDLQIAPTPQLSGTAALWHLSTPDHREAARIIHDRIGSRVGVAPDPSGRRGPRRRRRRDDRRAGGRPRVLRGRDRMVRPTRRRPLGGVHPLRGAVGGPPQR